MPSIAALDEGVAITVIAVSKTPSPPGTRLNTDAVAAIKYMQRKDWKPMSKSAGSRTYKTVLARIASKDANPTCKTAKIKEGGRS